MDSLLDAGRCERQPQVIRSRDIASTPNLVPARLTVDVVAFGLHSPIDSAANLELVDDLGKSGAFSILIRIPI